MQNYLYNPWYKYLRFGFAFLCHDSTIQANLMVLAAPSVGIAGVAAVSTQFRNLLTKEFFCQFYAMLETGTLVEGVERNLLNE